MNAIDFQGIASRLNIEELCRRWLPDGKRQGREWVARNPRRADKTAGSFSVNLNTGAWSDFAADGVKGGDVISLCAYLYHGGDQVKAARELAGEAEHAPPVARPAEKRPERVTPVPANANPVDFRHPRYGDQPTATWAYRDREGRVMMYVARFDPADSPRKQICARSWCRHPNGREEWRWQGFVGAELRPLYGLDRLGDNDNDAVVVEGEKAADAGQELIGKRFPVLSWMGGVDTASKADVEPLRGRRVILWPDFDAKTDKATGELLPLHQQPGMRAMLTIAERLKGVAREVVLVGYTPGKYPDGHDLADGWKAVDALRYMAENAGDPLHKANAPAPEDVLPLHAALPSFGFPHVNDKGMPLSSIENLAHLMGSYGIGARYNQVRKNVELNIPGTDYTVDNRSNCALAELGSLCSRARMPKGDLEPYVKLIADRNSYCPVREWIESEPWDGEDRIAALMATVQSPSPLKDRLMYRWLISAVAALYHGKNFESHGALVFVGDQGKGKTRWAKRLAGELQDVVLVGAVLDPADKDSVTNVVSHWIVELGELDATFKKADIARLKGFVTKAVDKLRRPYDRIESEYPRRTVFFASVNDPHYLVDDSGNRRWWTVPVTAIDYTHDINMQQLWTEVLEHYRRGVQWWLTTEENEQLKGLNEAHEAVDPVEELILSRFDWEGTRGFADREMTASDVLRAIGFDKPNKQQATHAAKVLRKLTGGEPKHTKGGRVYAMPKMKGGGHWAREDDDRPF